MIVEEKRNSPKDAMSAMCLVATDIQYMISCRNLCLFVVKIEKTTVVLFWRGIYI